MIVTWHQWLGHPTVPILKQILSFCKISYSLNKNHIYHAYQNAKSHKSSFPLSTSRAQYTLALVHTDLWGPVPTYSITGAKYFLLFVDYMLQRTKFPIPLLVCAPYHQILHIYPMPPLNF